MKLKNHLKKKIKAFFNDTLSRKVYVPYVLHDISLPNLETIKKGNWIDLRVPGDVILHKGVSRMISLGITMYLPDEIEANVLPRSSTYKNYGIILLNSQGVIDDTYRGPKDVWHANVIQLEDKGHITHCDRVFQFRLNPAMNASPVTKIRHLFTKYVFNRYDQSSYEKLCAQNKVNNRGGIGSTGKR